MPYLDTADRSRLHVVDWGGAARQPIVFTHAWGVDQTMWNYQFPTFLNAGLRCVGYDRRGHGRSDIAELNCDLDTLADDLAVVLDRLDLTDVLLVGHSLGAGEAVRYLTRHGSDRVAGLVLSAPSAPMLGRTEDNPDGLDPAMDAGLVVEAMGTAEFLGAGYQISGLLNDITRQQILATPAAVLLATFETNVTLDVRAELAELTLPTLVIQGDADVNNPFELTGRRCAELVPGAKLVVVEGAGHGLYLSAAQRYAEEILAFADSIATNSVAG